MTYETHLWKEPELPFILNHRELNDRFRISGANWHENTELLLAESGAGYVLNNGKRIELSPGDAVMLSSNVIHDVGTESAFSYHYLIVDRLFCLSNYFDSNQIHYTQERIRDPEVVRLMGEIISDYHADVGAPFRTQSIRANVLALLVHLGRNYTVSIGDQADSRVQSGVKQAIDRIRGNLSMPDLSLDGIAESCGISKFYFARKFRQITGYTCVDYINVMRCEKAKTLLACEQTRIQDVGTQCGFNSHSYFTRVFRAYTGQSPKDYRSVHCR